MGYDFMFMSLALKGPFPTAGEEINDAEFPDAPSALPWRRFRDLLLGAGGRVNGAEDCIWVDYPDGGSICFFGDEQSILLDTHANWAEVLRAYRTLKSLCPDVWVFDPQPGLFHDEKSFVRFLAEHGVHDAAENEKGPEQQSGHH